MKLRILLPLAMIGASSFANAAISIIDSYDYTTSPTNGIVRQDTYTLTSATDLAGFDPTGASKLVVTISSENAVSIPIITYGGVAMTEAVQFVTTAGNQYAGIFYLENPVGAGDLFVNPSGGSVNGLGVSLLALSGTASGVGPANNSDGQSTSLTTTVANSLVVAAHANNGNSGTAQSPLTPLFDDPAGSAGGGSGYGIISSTALGSYAFTGSASRPVTVAAAFAPAPVVAVPEPTSALFSCLGALILLRRRRS